MKVRSCHVLFLLIWLSGCLSFWISAQDVLFTKYYANPLHLNPALAGMDENRSSVKYRNQWPKLYGNFITFSGHHNQYLSTINSGVGLRLLHDIQGNGTLKESSAALSYAYQLDVNEEIKLIFGAEAALIHRRADWNKITFGDMIDPRQGFVYTAGDVPIGSSRNILDLSFGLAGNIKTIFYGAAIHHVNRPNTSLIVGNNALPMRKTLHAGANIPLFHQKENANQLTIAPNVVFIEQQNFHQWMVGSYCYYNRFSLGAWYSKNDVVAAMCGISLQYFTVAYSYNYNIATISSNSSGGIHELSVVFSAEKWSKEAPFKLNTFPKI